MKVPFLDLTAPYKELRDELDAAYRRVMESGRCILGWSYERKHEQARSSCRIRS